MKNEFYSIVAIAAFSTLATSALSAERAFMCEYKTGVDVWTPEASLFVFDEEKQTAQAYDYFIKTMHGNPIKVDMSRPSQKRIQFNWKLKGVPTKFSDGDTLKVDLSYRATLNSSTKQATLRVVPNVDVLNGTKATGTCRPVKP
ncbi:MAG: hypothetical protein GY883_14590 [Shimia sp.]|nr:hypothetical protein [Shimia sp.]